MILYPAIDLRGGACVRLEKGELERETVFNDSPSDQAQQFSNQGFSWLHVVDLDGAFSGAGQNRDAIRAIRSATHLKIQLGGGIRDLSTIESWLSEGVNRIILGTIALRKPEVVREAASKFPGHIAVGIDARDGRVAVSGWTETTSVTDTELARRMKDCGVSCLIHTDINRDGLLGGANVAASESLAKSSGLPVIVSGGMSSLADIETASKAAGISGAIVGRAFYDKRLTPHAALEVAGSQQEAA